MINDFLHSLCRYLATQTGLKYGATPQQLWRGLAVEGTGCATTWSVLSVYPGPALSWHPLPRMAVQVLTTGGDEAALQQAQTLFEACCAADKTPLRMTVINGFKAADNTADGTWRLVSVDPMQRPGAVGRDENRRQRVSFNVEIGYFKAT